MSKVSVKTKSTIQINGKSYDPDSGVALPHARPARQAAKHVAHHAPQQSKILMRHAVKRPQRGENLTLRVQGHLDIVNPGEIRLPSRTETRLLKAKHVPKSGLISHFSANQSTPAPHPPTATPPPSSQPFADVVAPKPAQPKQPLTTSEILEHALNQATSHQNKPPKHPRSRLRKQLSMVAGVTLAVGLLTVIAAKNLPGAQLQVASAKAGFSAKLPDFQPAGFSQSGLSEGPGEVAAQFQSQTDSRNYTITQKTTSWNSTALRDNFVNPTDPYYDTVNAGGQTVYIYGNHNATWVKNGIWYDVQANGALNDHQLVELASTL